MQNVVQHASLEGGKVKLGKHFTLAELSRTSTGLANAPDAAARVNLQELVQVALDPLREHLGRPLKVTSGYRSRAVNTAVKGSKNSRHLTGEASDVKSDGLTAVEIVAAIILADISFDQVIAYAPSRGGHVHIQICAGAPGRHRKQLLWAPASGGYEAFDRRLLSA